MQLLKYSLFQNFFVFIFTLLFNVSTYALSPELLQQLQQENIVDTTSGLAPQEIQLLKSQNEKLENERHVSVKILILNDASKQIDDPKQLDEISDQIKSSEPNIEDHIFILIGKKDHINRVILNHDNKNIVNETHEYGNYISHNNKLTPIEYIILEPLLKENKLYPALQASQTYIEEISLKQQPSYETFYYGKKRYEDSLQAYYIFYISGTFVFLFFSIALCRFLYQSFQNHADLVNKAQKMHNLNLSSTSMNKSKIYIFSAVYLTFHILLSITLSAYYLDLNFLFLLISNIAILLFYLSILWFSSPKTLDEIFSFKKVLGTTGVIFLITIIFTLLPASSLGLYFVFISFMIIVSYFYNKLISSILKYLFKVDNFDFHSMY
ncbi:hypothetical protein BEN71_15320 [Acinetobacter wuhouensis]|uniref:hypothetical protein n=1 Tax=Acinetobacter wuhouensis TaxID=1879050 RepID=UPI00083AA164|nr:hypothetical protein [Acinetobacter wuhouensis]AXQ23357.1 hypothetical protein BEN71_15320 [Acinetobacter wuhouensis]